MLSLGDVVATGDGLTSGRVGDRCRFKVVNATEIAVDITGPSRAKINIEALPPDAGESGFSITYDVDSPGEYTVNIQDKGAPIPGSPFKAQLVGGGGGGGGGGGSGTYTIGTGSGGDSTKVKVVGPGMVTGMAGKPSKFYVDCKNAGGGGKLHLRLMGPAKAQLREVEPGYGFEYVPAAPGKHQIVVEFNGQPVPDSPFVINIKEDPNRHEPYSYPNRVQLEGDGLLGGQVNSSVCFDVLMADAGAGDLRVSVTGPVDGAIRDGKVNIRNNPAACSARVDFEPTQVGGYKVEVKFSGEDVPRSPFVIYVN
ncbi:filamin-C-like [Oscarella lobularis]|uniref:filamin-C-like n=1 Tax=Oscarella lobularis TaxID=121494 RepID=UPI0033139407